VGEISEVMKMKHRVLASFSLFHENDKNVVKHTLESTITVGFGHDTHPLLPDCYMIRDITILLARDARRVIPSLDPCVLDTKLKMESGEI
jgi:hypothetical protein